MIERPAAAQIKLMVNTCFWEVQFSRDIAGKLKGPALYIIALLMLRDILKPRRHMHVDDVYFCLP